ncbi:CubicO group peptidase (beta-lactamase class C family) [Agromyces flavus]|uniref:CubicO group peptidase (Beta-lactamase class C family) n=1 Tax=Agromyces flavus TaxID=589382 RepID=A0A1H1W018_9MICO|nr:serine hydrolase [Agromyces flavus]MCP2366042.1 CubicO group peptidase (beta-lactamase class C family) [Agromyces flavus]GGI43883.1 6-aminohexanoate-dimer hydrolase [Agromyces flavus]SDS89836.1 CubicO group peptidase, beta-lactamase class C family [Agromyces flavus]
MRILRRVVAVVAVLVLVVIAAFTGVSLWQQPILLTGTGYAAHNACAVTEVTGRDDPETDLPPNPLVPYLRVDGAGDPTTGSLLGALARQKAWYAEGFGCTLAPSRPDLGEASAIDAGANPFTDVPAPAPNPALDDAMAAAFADDDEILADVLGTRAVVIVKDGELVAERYAEGFDADTRQLGWSMSKSVASLLAGVLVEQGVVSLDDDHLRPEWTDERADITIEQLLRMTSGLDWDETYDLGTPITRMLYLEPDMGDYVASLPLAHEPGAVQLYSSGSTTLLCDILTERTGVDADLPRQELLGPLGLTSAVLEPDASGTPVCSSYVWATPRDWAAIGQFALQNGEWNGEQLLPRDWMLQSLTVTDVDETDDPGYGMGWRTNTMPDGSLRWPELPADTYYAAGHDGQKMLIVPSEQLVVLRMGFTPEASEDESVVQLVEDAIAAL